MLSLTKVFFSEMRLKNRHFCCIMHICGDIDKKIGKGEEMKLKRVHSAVIATLLTCSMVVTPVFADPAEEQADLENQKANAQSELNSLQNQLNDLITKTNDLELQLIQTGEEINQAEADLEAAQEKKEQQYEAMKLRIKYMYESGTGTATMEKVMSSGDISSILTQAEYSQQVHEYDRNQLREYANTVKEIEDLQSTLETEMANLQDLEADYKSQQEELNTTISSKQDEISNLDTMIQEAARKAQEEAERKAAEEERQRQQEAAAREESQQSQDNTTTTTPPAGDTGSDTSDDTTSGGDSGYDAVTGNAIVDRAYGKIGCWYEWGACGPNTFDCSGLVSYCLTGSYTRLGTTLTFMGWTRVSDPQPGDICTSATHCGIYIGNGQMIHAPQTGEQVKIGPVQSGMIYVRY